MADPQRPGPGPVPAGPPGYVIRPPQGSTPAPAQPGAPAASQAQPAPAATPGAPVPVVVQPPVLVGGLSPNGAILCSGILVLAAVVFLFLRGAVRSHLIGNRAPLAAANGASWALFAFLFVATATVVLGTVGQLWTLLSFSLPLGALCCITLALFLVLYNSATRVGR